MPRAVPSRTKDTHAPHPTIPDRTACGSPLPSGHERYRADEDEVTCERCLRVLFADVGASWRRGR